MAYDVVKMTDYLEKFVKKLRTLPAAIYQQMVEHSLLFNANSKEVNNKIHDLDKGP